MTEAFLHHVWKFLKFEDATSESGLLTTTGQNVQILKPGIHNQLSGPDFFNAQLRIDDQLWAGNVEIHLKSSDWYVHNHEKDEAYANVILHVVWEEDCEVFDKANQSIPTIELKDRVTASMLAAYENLLERKQANFINCETDFGQIPEAVLEPWLERIYIERLERKVLEVENQLVDLNGDWESVLFTRLARSFGTQINAEAFEELANRIPFSVIRKLSGIPGRLESTLLGLSGLLPDEPIESQPMVWKQDFSFVKAKFEIPQNLNHRMQFYKLRPPNFPTIRISQLANLYEQLTALFEKCMQFNNRQEFQKLFDVKASEYWDSHFTFGKTHTAKSKRLSSGFIDILLINAIIPVKFAYARHRGIDVEEAVLNLLTQIPAEKNSLVAGFVKLRSFNQDALHSQSLIQLKKNYCDRNKCLSCQVGNFLLRPLQANATQ